MTLHIGETGKTLRFAAGFDLSSNTELTVVFELPDGAIKTKTKTGGEITLGLGIITDPDMGQLAANQYVEYVIESGFLSQTATWKATLTYTNSTPTPDDVFIADCVTFPVADAFDCTLTPSTKTFTFTPTPYHLVVLGDGPIWYARLGDESADPVLDEVAGANGTRVGATTGATSLIPNDLANDAMSFSANEYIRGPADDDIFSFVDGGVDQPFSIEAFINTTNLASHNGILGKADNPGLIQNEWLFYVWPSGKLSVTLYGGNTGDNYQTNSTNAVISINNTYHVVCTTTGVAGEALLYVNGAPVPVDYVAVGSYTSMQNTPSLINIGVNFLGAGLGYFYGVIDEVSLFDKTLTPAQVLNHYNASL